MVMLGTGVLQYIAFDVKRTNELRQAMPRACLFLRHQCYLADKYLLEYYMSTYYILHSWVKG